MQTFKNNDDIEFKLLPDFKWVNIFPDLTIGESKVIADGCFFHRGDIVCLRTTGTAHIFLGALIAVNRENELADSTTAVISEHDGTNFLRVPFNDIGKHAEVPSHEVLLNNARMLTDDGGYTEAQRPESPERGQ